MSEAIGLIETKGLVSCIYAADAMGKAANVQLEGFDNVGSGYVSVIIKGDVGAVNAAVEAGVSAAKTIGEVVAWKVIPRPNESTGKVTRHHQL
ncbi:BMC domain-containing protein [Endozoicomonas ascidiicola]|uniref:BMC domain-containing protein n=1 Tax=Endozoicomonas ascidiicola TaxID=1698521 RepID=UPI000832FB7A|nr:BMC domain-containing protein [Endozoicomonas ascidiicola]